MNFYLFLHLGYCWSDLKLIAATAAAAAAGASAAAVVAEHVPISMLKDYYHTMGIDRFYHIDIN